MKFTFPKGVNKLTLRRGSSYVKIIKDVTYNQVSKKETEKSPQPIEEILPIIPTEENLPTIKEEQPPSPKTKVSLPIKEETDSLKPKPTPRNLNKPKDEK